SPGVIRIVFDRSSESVQRACQVALQQQNVAMIEVSSCRIRCQPNGTQVALHRLFDPALRLKNMSFVNQTQRILFRCAHLASATVRDGLAGRAKSIEYSHLTTLSGEKRFCLHKKSPKVVSNFLVE